MLPFLVDMNELFEQFVAEWLRVHIPRSYSLKAQTRFVVGDDYNLQFIIDLVVTDVRTGKAVCVLDTKYKRAQGVAAADVEQVIAYAEAKQSNEAILVYPVAMIDPVNSVVGRIRVRSLTFSLADDLETAGQNFMKALFSDHSKSG